MDTNLGGQSRLDGAKPIVIGVCTRSRQSLLHELLRILAKEAQTIPAPAPRIRFLVVDNDKDFGSMGVVDEYNRSVASPPAFYVAEPRPGVGYARRRLLESVRAEEDLIIFDDDQVPSAGWLLHMLEARRRLDGCILIGPVLPRFTADLPVWGKAGWAWGDREKPDGYRYRYAGFGNILLPRTVLALDACKVPDRFLASPGEDTVITARLAKAGVPILHVASAAAHEMVGGDRLKVQWVLKRYYRSGIAWVSVNEDLGLIGPRLLATLAKSSLRAVLYLFISACSLSPSLLARSMAESARAAGLSKGLGMVTQSMIRQLVWRD